MPERPYSKSETAGWIFRDLLNSIARRGWFTAGPRLDDGQSLLYTAFHVHPDDADRVFSLLQDSVREYGGRTKWSLDRKQHNRFFVCPLELAMLAKRTATFDEATEMARQQIPGFERQAAIDLIKLSDFIFELYSRTRNSH